jgi:glucosamine--fructose-6-phosphate aminotransferase (isomerizing)
MPSCARNCKAKGFFFTSETDTEVIAHLLAHLLESEPDLLRAVQKAVKQLVGAYGLAVSFPDEPDRLVVARAGSPLVVGLGQGENFIASDVFALLPVTQRFVFLEEGDVAEIRRDAYPRLRCRRQSSATAGALSQLSASTADKGPYAHYMLKEIFEQPSVIAETLEGRIHKGGCWKKASGMKPRRCSTRHPASTSSPAAPATTPAWWRVTGWRRSAFPCSVEVASEYRYRKVVVPPGTLFLSISQSGETADTLAALRFAKTAGYVGSLTICNVPESSLTRNPMWP